MAHEDQAFQAGKLVVFSEGEYSDYGYRGSYVALETVTWAQLREAADKVLLSEGDDSPDLHSAFEAEMIRRGWLLSVDTREIHIGNYRRLELG